MAENVPAALAMAGRFRDALGHDAARGDALAAVVNRIELSPIRLRVILSAAALAPSTREAIDPQEAVLLRDVLLRMGIASLLAAFCCRSRTRKMLVVGHGRQPTETYRNPCLSAGRDQLI
jgi:hypothetical protein